MEDSNAEELSNCDPQEGEGKVKKSLVDGGQIREEKRKKWEAKQERARKRQFQGQVRMDWFERNSDYATLVKADDVNKVKTKAEDGAVLSKLHALLRPYFDLQEGPSKTNDSKERLFIAEGTENVRLFIHSGLEIKSIFVKPNLLFEPPVNLLKDVKDAAETQGHSTPPFHVLVGEEDALSQAAGFQISRGALACGVVPQRDEPWLLEYLLRLRRVETETSLRILALDGISDTANLGSIIRCASAFGIQAVILSRDCCDAWYRRAVRVSMGHIARVPCVRVDNLALTLQKLSKVPYSVTSYAAIVNLQADLILENIERGKT